MLKFINNPTTYNLQPTSSQSGQSLIETIIAIFVLTTGLTSALSLAIFSFSSSTDISQKVVATGLSREGLEVVRRMRDSNWLAGQLSSCPDLGSEQQCYTTWLTGGPFNIQGSVSGTTYKMVFDPTALGNKWTLSQTSSGADYRLYRQAGSGLSSIASASPTNFYRKITIIYKSTSGDYTPTSPQVLVRSAVWWWGKNCVEITNLVNPSDTNCKIITEEYLTNWRNY